MLSYTDIRSATWVTRLNRFSGIVRLDGREERVHVRNSGRLRELLIPGAQVVLEPAARPERATRYTLIAVQAKGQWVNIDSIAPNRLLEQALRMGRLPEFGAMQEIQAEVRHGASRFDLAFTTATGPSLMEVKGVTLVENGVARFPDAPTLRGARHMRELAEAAEAGFRAWVVFVIQRADADSFQPNWRTDPDFAAALVEAAQRGVHIRAYRCRVRPGVVSLADEVPVDLSAPA